MGLFVRLFTIKCKEGSFPKASHMKFVLLVKTLIRYHLTLPKDLSCFTENSKILQNQIDPCAVCSHLSATIAMSVTVW